MPFRTKKGQKNQEILDVLKDRPLLTRYAVAKQITYNRNPKSVGKFEYDAIQRAVDANIVELVTVERNGRRTLVLKVK